MVVQRVEIEDTPGLSWLGSAVLKRFRARTDTYSVVTCLIVLFMGALYAFELFEYDITVFEFWLAAVLLSISLLMAVQVLALGLRIPLWVGLVVVIAHAVVSVYFLMFSDERQNSIASLQQVPILAMYCAWFYGAVVARVTVALVVGAVVLAIALGSFGQPNGMLGPVNVFGVAVFSWLCLEMGLFVRHRMVQQINTDALTGALNRRGFFDKARRVTQGAQRDGAPLTLAVLDLDHFKSLNDGEGHAAGDDVLKSLAAQWVSLSRPHDVLGRLGGDEFVMLLPETTAVDATRLLQRMRELAIHPWSWGVAEFASGETIDDAVRRADEAMYEQKRNR